MRESVSYVNELKKMSILSITMEKQDEDMRESMQNDKTKVIKNMKAQAQNLDHLFVDD